MVLGKLPFRLVCGAAGVLLVTGCDGGKTRIGPVSVSASGAASQAMQLYDKDGDGVLKGAELDKASGIKAAIEKLDTDGDGGVSKAEISARIGDWMDSKIGLANVRCRVTMNGRPLTDATVTFEPEPIFDGEIKSGSDVTDALGEASPTLAKEDRPDPLFGGMTVGFYKVRVSKESNGKETIPAKFNRETILGQEIGPDAAGLSSDFIALDLED